jgi:hypothetical protein
MKTRGTGQWRKPWLIIVVILLGLFAWWRLSQPKGLRLVGAYSAANYFTPSRQGFLLREKLDLLVLHDWRTGRARWQVRTNGPKLPPGAFGYEFLRYRFGWSVYNLSADGRTLAAVIAERPHLHCYTWRDGKLMGEVLLRNQQRVFGYGNLRVLDDGRVFYWGHGTLPHPVILIDNGRVAAKGICPPILLEISSDGRLALQMQYTTPMSYYSLLHVRGSAIRFTRQSTILPTNTYMLESVLVSNDGKVFNAKGFLRSTAPWFAQHQQWASTRGEFAHTVQFMPYSRGKTLRARVWNPSSGKGWGFSPPFDISNNSCTYTAAGDGTHALVYRTIRTRNTATRLLERIPVLWRLARVTHGEVRIYQRPGKLYARQSFPRNLINTPKGRCQIMGAYPAPDGKSVVLVGRPLHTRKRVYCLMRVE